MAVFVIFILCWKYPPHTPLPLLLRELKPMQPFWTGEDSRLPVGTVNGERDHA